MRIGLFKHLGALTVLTTLFFSSPVKAQMTGQIGTGTQAPLTNNSIYSPICRFDATSGNDCSRSNLLYTASELSTIGITSGATISKISFYKIGNGATTAGFTFEIYMRNSSTTAPLSTATTWANILGTHTQVYATTSQTINAATGWVDFILTTPFVYTGQNLEIAMTHDMSAITGNPTTGPFDWQYTNGFQDYIIGTVSTSLSGVATLSGTVANYKVRPNIQFEYTPGLPCTSPPVPGNAIVSNPTPCPGASVTLNLQNNSMGSGQTYQWESSGSPTGPWMIEATGLLGAAYSVTPSAGTTYYRAQVTCGASTTTSSVTSLTVATPMSGTYTINATQPASGTNFQSFGAALGALTCAGISGAVQIDVAVGSGPYNEQAIIGSVAGASASTPIIINGNGETIAFTSTVSATRPTILLDGAKFVTLNNLNIAANGTTYGWGVHLTNDADNDTIKNCTITIASASTTAANTGGIVVSGSGTSITTAGNSDDIVILNNTIKGGYQGVILRGATATPLLNNKIIGNTIQDQYGFGIQALYTTNSQISENDISRPLRTTTATTFAGIELGTGNSQAVVSSNKIHATHTAMTTQSGAAYGIHLNGSDAGVGQENLIFNNLIYNFNSTTGIQNGLRNTGSDGAFFYHNTVVHDASGSTAGDTYPFYQTTTAANIDVRNNIFYVTRSGSGVKHCLYFNDNASTIISDNNVLYMNAPAGTNYIGRANGTSHATMNAWQGTGFDLSGSDQNPLFQNEAVADYTPTNSVINNIGIPLASVTVDINNATRSTVSPDPGAFENLNFPLSVTLLDFSAVKKGNDALLHWTVADEKDMKAYVVERSFDGVKFGAAKELVVNNDHKNTDYDFTDIAVFHDASVKVVFYRLRMMDQSGSSKLSEIAKLLATPNSKVSIEVYPNPVSDLLKIKVTGAHLSDNGTISVTDASGREVRKTKIGASEQSINMTGLPSGIYLVKYVDGTTVQTFRVTKQ
ncbi:MAG TPA: T9SS type A sorting domain-containing protein [Flavipsychrobacter sp.]|nr:T9SS type A sorting domain-containing protein [Flavipsychrobacter sp.]